MIVFFWGGVGVEGWGEYYFVCVFSLFRHCWCRHGDPFLCLFDALNSQQMVHQKRLHRQRYEDYLKGTPEKPDPYS